MITVSEETNLRICHDADAPSGQPVGFFELVGGRVLIPRLPRDKEGITREADGRKLFDTESASERWNIPAEDLREAYLSFCEDVAPMEPLAAGQADEARRVLRQVKFGHLPDDHFELLLAECRARGLSPWGRHLWADVRISRVRNRRELVIGFTIDGIRARAEAHPDYAGQGRLRWRDAAGNWTEVWLADDPPAAAEASVHRRGFVEPMVRVATFKDCAPIKIGPRGRKILPDRWQRSPARQLGRVAEALALLAAFPEKFAKMRLAEEIECLTRGPHEVE